MSETAANQIEYFLGIEGEQKGPFSHGEVFQMLSSGQITQETPVWFSGMTDWVSVGSLEQFNSTVGNESVSPQPELLRTSPDTGSASSVSSQNPQPKRVLNKIPASEEAEPKTEVFETVFSNAANFEEPGRARKKFSMMVGGAFVLVLFAGGIYWLQSQNSEAPPPEKKTTKISADEVRKNEFRKVQIKYSKNPDDAIYELTNLLTANPKDNVGLESLEMLLSYYRQKQLNSDVGKVLMIAKRPSEALEYFLKDPPDYNGAEKAYEEAAKIAKGNEKKEYLLKQIELLINRLNQGEKAVNAIQSLEKEFPGTPHPYQYYLKSTDEKIADIFSRMSFYFSNTLKSFLVSELPQLQFEGKPLLQITKDSAKKYRVVATYKGPVVLRNDNLSSIYFVFWLSNEQWVIVDTNLTKERAKFAQQDQKKLINDVVSDVEMLRLMENLFRTQFPGKGLHEMVTSQKRSSAGTVE